jgi:hypothetical protein
MMRDLATGATRDELHLAHLRGNRTADMRIVRFPLYPPEDI